MAAINCGSTTKIHSVHRRGDFCAKDLAQARGAESLFFTNRRYLLPAIVLSVAMVGTVAYLRS